MKIYDRKKLPKPNHYTFKTEHFQMLLITLEKTYHDYWYLIKEDIQIRYEKELLRLVDKIYKIIENIQPIEHQIYRTDLSWRVIDQFLGINKKVYNHFIVPLDPDDIGEIDEKILMKDLEFINNLHDTEQVEMEDLTLLQDKALSWNTSIKDYVYDEFLFRSSMRGKPVDLSLKDFDLILFLIEEILRVKIESKDSSDLINTKMILIDYFDSFYGMFDILITL